MRNRGRRSRGSDDINLTPLLDVLFRKMRKNL